MSPVPPPTNHYVPHVTTHEFAAVTCLLSDVEDARVSSDVLDEAGGMLKKIAAAGGFSAQGLRRFDATDLAITRCTNGKAHGSECDSGGACFRCLRRPHQARGAAPMTARVCALTHVHWPLRPTRTSTSI